jgi:hypothetical protein
MHAHYPQHIVEQAIAEYLDGATSYEVAAKYGMSVSALCRMLRRKGLKARGPSECKRIYGIDETFFERIDSHDKAKVLGFIYADGCVSMKSPTSGVLQVILHPKDADYLEWLRCTMKNERPLRYVGYMDGDKMRDRVECTASHPKIITDIKALGVIERKSLTVGFPTEQQVPSEYMGAFICGVFEGDGCIHLRGNRGGPTMIAQISIMGSTAFIEGLAALLEGKHGMKTTTHLRPTKQTLPIATLRIYRVQDVMRLYDLMYDNPASFRMGRKHDRFAAFKAQFEEVGDVYELKQRKAFSPEHMVVACAHAKANGMAKARELWLKAPNGKVHRANAVKPFCRENELTAKHVFRVMDGKAQHHKGWVIPLPDEIDAARAAGTLVERLY